MKIAILTNEYPPNVYGGAGVHVENLCRELAQIENGAHSVEVLCFGDQREDSSGIRVTGIAPRYRFGLEDPRIEKLSEVLLRDVVMSGVLEGADVVHCHTWYVHLAGCLLKQLLNAPLFLTTHSLEPQRPWKAEQLGPGYRVSGWIEETAYRNADGIVAVSGAMKKDVQDLYGTPPEKVRVIYNGIDPVLYAPAPDPSVAARYGIDASLPIVLFVGRITRQKGIIHLVNGVRHVRADTQIVLCAGAPDTPEIESEMAARVRDAGKESRNPIVWIPRTVPQKDLISLYSLASVFACPSIYEPFGLINIEAMACGAPVVGSAVGGIPEIVVDGKTGLVVPFEPEGRTDPEPKDPERFSKDFAEAVNRLLDSPETARRMGMEGRRRVEEIFSWKSIAKQTLSFYRDVLEDR